MFTQDNLNVLINAGFTSKQIEKLKQGSRHGMTKDDLLVLMGAVRNAMLASLPAAPRQPHSPPKGEAGEHKTLYAYVPGCYDVGKVELRGFTLIADNDLAALKAAALANTSQVHLDMALPSKRVDAPAAAQGVDTKLPPHRARFNINGPDGHRIRGWDAEQMLTYGAQQREAGRREGTEVVNTVRQEKLDYLSDILDAKEMMRAAGVADGDFSTMFAQFAALSRQPADEGLTDERIIQIKTECGWRYNSLWDVSDSAACEFARALLSAPVAAVPQGDWKLVPIAMTKEMRAAGVKLRQSSNTSIDGIYAAILAAAPPSKMGEDDKCDG